jgi:hypothetical protein
MVATDRYSIPTLSGEDAERFIKFDSSEPTKEDIENQEEAKEKYLQRCDISKITT